MTPASAGAAGWEQRVVSGMDTHVYTPDALSPVGDGRGLLIVLHGCVQTAAQLRSLGNLEAAADGFGVVVAVPQVPNGGVYAGCWDYYGANHSRDNRHNDDLLGLVDELSSEPGLAIDLDQVYLSGFSSGGGQAIATGCLAPDVFAGVGIAAGPSLGTEAVEIGFVSTTSEAAAALCETLAGPASADFATQLTAVHTGTFDFTVAQDYAQINAEAFATRYGPGLTESPLDVASLEGFEPAGEGTWWSDADGPRIAKMTITGASHAWPAGSGAGGVTSFVEAKGVNYGWFLAEFFTMNNRRVEAPVEPGTTGDPTDTTGDDSSSGGTDGSTGGDTSGEPGTSSGEPTDDGSSTGDDSTEPTGAPTGPGITGGGGGSSTDGADLDEDLDGCCCRHDPRGGGATGGLALMIFGLLTARGRRRSSPGR
ncbi:MAG: PHB depolymerase family esterase [Myxococcales bacterium]|nr:PHB depolymerase family esterase [Myxococcales bacterium]MCB9749107.1 PHB depolymerase family esterase [Myxococcales bacterium]